MSVNVEYPSEYFKEAITAKDEITANVDFTADKDGVTPLTYLINNNNQVEIKRIVASHAEEVAEIVRECNILPLCTSVATFKLLHNCYHSVNKDYEISHFEDAMAITSGATLYQHAHRVKSDDKIDETVKAQLTSKGLCNFIKNITWTAGKTLAKERSALTPGAECLIYMTDFISQYYDKEAFFEINEENGKTPLHKLVKGDNLGRFLYVIKAFELENIGDCVDGFGNTLLNWAIQNNSKKIVEYLITTEGLSVNDAPNEEGRNSACSLFTHFSEKNLRIQHYVNMIDESKLKDPKLSVLNCARATKLDLSEIVPMSDKLLNSGTGTKGESYRMILDANAATIKAAEDKAQAALVKAQSAVKK